MKDRVYPCSSPAGWPAPCLPPSQNLSWSDLVTLDSQQPALQTLMHRTPVYGPPPRPRSSWYSRNILLPQPPPRVCPEAHNPKDYFLRLISSLQRAPGWQSWGFGASPILHPSPRHRPLSSLCLPYGGEGAAGILTVSRAGSTEVFSS